MRKIHALMAALLAFGISAAWADSPKVEPTPAAVEQAIRKAVEPRLTDDVKIDAITKTPYSGLYELRVGSDIYYADAKGEYLFLGRVIDTKTFQDQTKLRLDELNQIKFSDLPFDSALKMVKGNGKRVIAVFEDPNCIYCKRFRKTLSEVDNVTVYTFMYNILSEDSIKKAHNIWCSADRNKAWDEWMLNGKQPATAKKDCTSPHAEILALGQKMRITGTPTIFFADGSRIPGAADAKALEAKWASLK